jgi:hypothetical protein
MTARLYVKQNKENMGYFRGAEKQAHPEFCL